MLAGIVSSKKRKSLLRLKCCGAGLLSARVAIINADITQAESVARAREMVKVKVKKCNANSFYLDLDLDPPHTTTTNP